MRIARDGFREIVIASAVTGVGGAFAIWAAMTVSPWYWLLASGLLAAWACLLAFFRDPDRSIPGGDGLLVSPADGKVTEITRLESYGGIDGPALRIGIFLSIFDVHVNRAPCGGRITKTEYKPGAFLDARHPESGSRNESNRITIESAPGLPDPIVVRQIAGKIARRVVCRLAPGDTIERGQRIGLIKFGSRTELIVPVDCGLEPTVQVNDHVKGGTTVLMRVVPRDPNIKSHEQHVASTGRA